MVGGFIKQEFRFPNYSDVSSGSICKCRWPADRIPIEFDPIFPASGEF